jgi:hypothetical protein
MQVVKATRARRKGAIELFEFEAEDGGEIGTAGIVIPVLVFDGDLYAASLDESGQEIKLERVDQHVLMWRHPIGGSLGIIVHVVSWPALEAFVNGAKKTLEVSVDWCNKNPRKVAQVYNSELKRIQRVLAKRAARE